MELYGERDNTGNCWHYIKNYADDPLEAISKALVKIGQVLELLLNTEAQLAAQ